MINLSPNILLKNKKLKKFLKISLISFIFVLVLALGFSPPQAKSQGSNSPTLIPQVPYNESRIQGYVNDESGSPLSDATVYYQQNGQNVSSGTTDSTGYYLSPLLPRGKYDLTAQKADYDLNAPVTVDTSRSLPFDNFNDNSINPNLWAGGGTKNGITTAETGAELKVSGTATAENWAVLNTSPVKMASPSSFVAETKFKAGIFPLGTRNYVFGIESDGTYPNNRIIQLYLQYNGWVMSCYNGSTWTVSGGPMVFGKEMLEYKTLKIVYNSSTNKHSAYVIDANGIEHYLGTTPALDLTAGGTQKVFTFYQVHANTGESVDGRFDDYRTYLPLEILPQDVIQADNFDNNSIDASLWQTNPNFSFNAKAGSSGLKIEETNQEIKFSGTASTAATYIPWMVSSFSNLDDEIFLVRSKIATLPTGGEAQYLIINNGTYGQTLRGVMLDYNSSGWRLGTYTSTIWNFSNYFTSGNEATEYKTVKIVINKSLQKVSGSVISADGTEVSLGSVAYDLSASGAINQIRSQLDVVVPAAKTVDARFDDYWLFRPHYKIWADDLILKKSTGGIQGYVKDEDGNYVQNAVVEMENADQTWTEIAMTDSTGYFIKKDLSPKTYNLRAKKDSPMYIYKNMIQVEVLAGITTWADDLIIQKAGKLKGKVYLETADHPLAGVQIKTQINDLEYYGQTNAKGDYQFLLPEGQVLVWAGYRQYDSGETKEATITFDQTTTLDFNLGKDFPGAMTGKVYDSAGNLVTDAAIVIDDEYFGYIDENGSYYIPGLPGGYLYSVEIVRDDGYYYPSEYENGLVDFDYGMQTIDFHGLTKYE